MSVALLVLLAQTAVAREVVIDTSRRTPISPYIYGANYPNNWVYDWLKEWRDHHDAFTFARIGGNRFTAYNWETNASNAGSDYFHENDDYLAFSNEPGWTIRHLLRAVQDAGAAVLVTVPIQGYVAADKLTDLHGDRDVGKTPNYLDVRFHRSYATKPGRVPSYPPDTTDKVVFQDEFVAWVERTKSARTPVWYSLDNEPDWWNHTHARIEPEKTTYRRILDTSVEYARMIKSVAPQTLVFGPANYGWQGMQSFQNAPDADGRNFVDTYLATMREASRKTGRRLLDVYDFHLYPEATGDGVRIIYNQAPDKPGTVEARIQAPRSLWDPTYVEESWIPKSLGDRPIMLLPRMKEKIARHYPGTKLSITEYEYGGRNTISGALAQADALGVFGRYGLFAASHWGVDHEEQPVYAAFQSFTNFDRRGSRFGDLGLAVRGENPAENSVYAALDSKNRRRLTIVAINKTSSPMPLSVALGGFPARTVRSFVMKEGAYVTPLPGDASLSKDRVRVVAPPLSVVSIEVNR
ncbi:MAG TPA: glycoside hydrolase family 44 protein [Fimbriimonas sp.]